MRRSPTPSCPPSVLGRAVAVLDAFDPEDVDVSLATLVERTGMAKSTTFRLASSLIEVGLLQRTPSGYRLGIHLFELGERVPQQRELRQLALPFMEDLYEATHDVVHLAILDGSEVLYVAKISGRRSSSLPSRTGGRQPAHCTALGKALMAFGGPGVVDRVVAGGLPRVTAHTIATGPLLRTEVAEVRRRGYAVEREEIVLGNCCVAAPVLDAGGEALAAISVGGPLARTDPERLGPAVRTATLALSRRLAGGRVVLGDRLR